MDGDYLAYSLQPRLIIHYEKQLRRVPATIGFENQHIICKVRFIISNDGLDKQVDCLSEDLIGLCRRLYASNFAMDCYGEGTASKLKYNWLRNALTIYDRRYDPLSIRLSINNIDAIKTIASPNKRDGCILY